MKFGSLEIDFTALAALLSAIAAIYTTFRGREQMRAKKQEVEREQAEQSKQSE